MPDQPTSRDTRWRLVLGAGEIPLSKDQAAMDAALAAVYDGEREGGSGESERRSGGLGASAPRVNKWLGDIRTYFPTSVVTVMQKDAITRLNLRQLLLEPEVLRSLEADVSLVATLAELSHLMPETAKDTARQVVRQVVDDVERRLKQKTVSLVGAAVNRAARTHRPKFRDIDWNRTIGRNLKHYLPEQRTIVPERLVGYSRAGSGISQEIVLLVDQSGSMAASVVYSSIFASVLASIRTVKTSLVVFDTTIVDLTARLVDPVDVIFGTQLGGGTDINQAVAYGTELIGDPKRSTLVLISDLYEGGVREELLQRVHRLMESGVTVIVLLALSDEGAPAYDRDLAAELAAMGVVAFACTPDVFPEMIAVAIDGGDLSRFATQDK